MSVGECNWTAFGKISHQRFSSRSLADGCIAHPIRQEFPVMEIGSMGACLGPNAIMFDEGPCATHQFCWPFIAVLRTHAAKIDGWARNWGILENETHAG